MSERVVCVVSLWVDEEVIAAYEDFEREAVRAMAEHGGRLERVIRCAVEPVITESVITEEPFEIHIVSFPDEAAFVAYRDGAAARALAPRRARLIRRSTVFVGDERPPYA